ncbi:hypothetical protein OG887_36455 [Streptomyces sp. NBC_00053]|uniref:hypothetical protein n=1 Tax=unclassified Streptomyces TaxID=2593676 RepID=UPI000F5BF891|nr:MULTISPECIES: hypothetical protein [unclassified Streptomyces]MCX5504821.1 hypothetical protein [Streptomyces sp. NBC_00052]MCX5546642.1 hypothetical protein [Streptomyces sp. NBC_00051]RPK65716.1 hypothetical protein EES42_24600 [Streptomyces sp. ADI95-17]WSX05628.1 hypothetical protein OG355_37100 [Streptomyces sp. NBC_00987]
MEIIPGRGVALAMIGDHRTRVEERVGRPAPGTAAVRPAVYDTTPKLVITYASDDTVELVEIGYSGQGGEAEASCDGIQLTHRLIDDVVAELHARGYTSTPCDIGHDFHAGFTVWSMRVLEAREVDPTAGEDDPRCVVEGVSVAPYGYFGGE